MRDVNAVIRCVELGLEYKELNPALSSCEMDAVEAIEAKFNDPSDALRAVISWAEECLNDFVRDYERANDARDWERLSNMIDNTHKALYPLRTALKYLDKVKEDG